MKKVIIIVLLLMFIVPLFDSDLYTDQANAFDETLSLLNSLLLQSSSQMATSDITTLVNQILTDFQDE